MYPLVEFPAIPHQETKCIIKNPWPELLAPCRKSLPSLVGQSGKANELDHRRHEQRTNTLREIVDAATKLRENATDIEEAIDEIDGYLTMLKELAVEVCTNGKT